MVEKVEFGPETYCVPEEDPAQNIKCFEDVTLTFPHPDGNYGGWNVILGENGRGKSTILRSIALGVLNPFVAFFALEQHEGQFARQRAKGRSVVTADLVFHPSELPSTDGNPKDYQRSLSFSPLGDPAVSLKGSNGQKGEEAIPHVLCFGYGPFGRLEGGGGSTPSAFQFPQPLSRFTTLFTDEIGLADATRSLIDLYIASVDPRHTSYRAAQQNLKVVSAVVDALLPPEVQMHSITSEKVGFITSRGIELSERELSDGYRSFLCLILDLLRHFTGQFGTRFLEKIRQEENGVTVHVEGVVLIDEADTHLHPRWQRELGEQLRKVFPLIQFIVTTHSPFIAQEATDGGLFILREGAGGVVQLEQPIESVRGWTASQILTSPLFGMESTRAPQTESLIREKTLLTAKEKVGADSYTRGRYVITYRKGKKRLLPDAA